MQGIGLNLRFRGTWAFVGTYMYLLVMVRTIVDADFLLIIRQCAKVVTDTAATYFNSISSRRPIGAITPPIATIA